MFLSLGLEVLLEDVVGGSFLAPVPDDTRGALDHLPSLALPVDLAESCPFSKLHVAINLQKEQSITEKDRLIIKEGMK